MTGQYAAFVMGLPKITKAVPSTLIAILVVALIVISFEIDTMTVVYTLKTGQSIGVGFPSFTNSDTIIDVNIMKDTTYKIGVNEV